MSEMASQTAHELIKQHPLQRLSSPSRGASAALHVLGLASFSYSFAYLIQHPNPINESYGWHLQYLTIIGLSLAWLTFFTGLVADLTLSRRVFAVKNALSVTSAPMECLISLLYWSLRTINPSLVLPDWAPPLTISDDLTFHAIPSLALIVDLLFFSPPYTIAFLPALAVSSCIAFGYWFWIELCFQHNHFYPYPIFEILTTPQRVGLFGFSAVLMSLSTASLIWLYGIVNGRGDAKLGNGSVARAKSGNVEGE